MMNVLALTLVPIVVGVCALALKDLKHLRLIGGIGGVAQLLATVAVAVNVFQNGSSEPILGWFRIDGLGAWFMVTNAIVYGAAMVSAAQLLEKPEDLHLSPKGVRVLFGLSGLFIVAANAVVCSADLGALWVAMEATTLVTAPLILLIGTRKAVEAAWKYFILCGLGLAFALLGTMFILAASGESGAHGSALSISWLMTHAKELKPSLLGAGFVFFVLGYGTKAGLFPVHNWLPDAHSQAPAPASALLSGALLNCAMVALWRIASIVELSNSGRLLSNVLAPMGAVTVLAASVMLIRQQTLKRMWAYSSIENMGLLAVAVAFRAAPIFALHALAHSLAKSSAFLLSGNVTRGFGTVTFSRLSGLMRRSPGLGFALIGAGAAVMGAPPFGSFVSEWLLLARAVDGRQVGIAIALVVGLAVSFVAVLIHIGRVVFGAKPERSATQNPPGSIAMPVFLLVFSALTFVAVSPAVLEFLGRVLLP